MTDYEKQAKGFLKETGTEFSVKFLKHGKHFEDDKEDRDIYEITLKRGEREYKFDFGQSINASGKFIVYSPDGKKKFNDLKLANKKYGHPILSRGEYERNKDFAEPTPYEVLAALTKYMPIDFKDFCSNYGYDVDSRKAEKIYHKVVDEVKNVMILFNDKEMDELRVIN